MTLERARQLTSEQVAFGSGYNRNATRLILAFLAAFGLIYITFVFSFQLNTVIKQ